MGLTDKLFKRKRPEWATDAGAAKRLDVRPLLARGEDPLRQLIELAEGIAAGETLVVDAPFDPAPLRRLLAGKGFEDYAEELSGDHWLIHFRRRAEPRPEATAGGATEARVWSETDAWHIDVRGLEPPEPMRAIVSLIERPGVSGPVIVHHEREPVYLYPELAERGWRWTPIAGEPGEVRLLLEREGE